MNPKRTIEQFLVDMVATTAFKLEQYRSLETLNEEDALYFQYIERELSSVQDVLRKVENKFTKEKV